MQLYMIALVSKLKEQELLNSAMNGTSFICLGDTKEEGIVITRDEKRVLNALAYENDKYEKLVYEFPTFKQITKADVNFS